MANGTETTEESKIAAKDHDAPWVDYNEEVWDPDYYIWDSNYNTWVDKKCRPKRQRNWLLGMRRSWKEDPEKDDMIANIALRRNELHKVQMYACIHAMLADVHSFHCSSL